jgi:hypothetical protein
MNSDLEKSPPVYMPVRLKLGLLVGVLLILFVGGAAIAVSILAKG